MNKTLLFLFYFQNSSLRMFFLLFEKYKNDRSNDLLNNSLQSSENFDLTAAELVIGFQSFDLGVHS